MTNIIGVTDMNPNQKYYNNTKIFYILSLLYEFMKKIETIDLKNLMNEYLQQFKGPGFLELCMKPKVDKSSWTKETAEWLSCNYISKTRVF